MSLIVKGMSLPRSCSTCRFSYFTVGIKKRCEISGDEVNPLIDHREISCPLSEIPTPHGRLIDCESDFFPTAFRHNLTDYAKGWNTCLRSVLLSPTIIEAEVSE